MNNNQSLLSLCAMSAIATFGAAMPAGAEPLEQVTVTASRSAEQQVAASISHIDQLPFNQATHINELLAQSPGSWISRGNGQEHLTAVRSPVLTGGGACGAFLMAEDSVPLRAPAFCNANQLFDVNYEQAASIEVLRGPGTAFHGNSAMHGVINVLSPAFADELNKSGGDVNKSTTELSATAASQSTKRLGIDHREANWMLQTHVDSNNGYKDDSGYEQQKLRFKALQQGENWTLIHSLNIANLDQETAGYVVGAGAYKDDARKKENGNPEAYRNSTSVRFSSELRMQTSDASELIFTPYARYNEMEFLMHFAPGTPLEENGHRSLGFQSAYVQQLGDTLQLSSGLDVDYSRGYLKQSQASADLFGDKFPQGQHYDYDVNVLDAAVFTQLDAQLSEAWELTLGLRLQQSRFDYSNNLSDGVACEISIGSCRYFRPQSSAQNFSNWSPQASLQYQFDDNYYAYVSLSRGFRAPHSSDLYRLEQGQVLADIDSEQLDSLELGFKGLIASKAAYQLSLFAMKKDNVIVKTSERERADGQQTKHAGIELDLDYPLSDRLKLSAALSYARHSYDSNVQLLNSQTEEIAGKDVDTAPRQMHNLRLSWTPRIGRELQLEGVYMGDYYLDSANRFSYSGHTLTNLRYSQVLPEGWKLQLALLNAMDVDYAERADISFGTTWNPSEERYFIGEPRNLRITLNKTF